MTYRDLLISQGVPAQTADKFLAYHKANPGVWEAFKRYALDAARRHAKIGAKAVMERVRWEAEIEQGREFKCGNSYTAYYARIFAIKFPNNRNLFEFRAIKGLKDEDD